MDKYYYNLKTGEVELGRKSGAFERMGPYDTYEEAAAALAAAQERTEAWDEADKEWREDWDGSEDDDAEHPDA
nr:SPOR domain-containing protein [Actinomycetales bacterium]